MTAGDPTRVDAGPDLADRLARADASLADPALRADDLHALLAEARASGRPDLAALAAAVLADHLLLHGDPSAVLLAVTTLDGLPDEAVPSPALALARARLRRVRLSATAVLDPAADLEGELRACLTDYLRAGRHDDRWLTVALVHTVRVATAWTATPADRAAVVEARDQLAAAGSPSTGWARLGVAVVAHALGDHDTVRAELAAVHDEPSPAAARHVTGMLDAVRLLVDASPGPRADDAVERLTGLAERVRAEVPAVSGGVVVVVAHALLDAGRADDAEQWLGRLRALPPALAHEDAERDVMAVRLELLRRPPGAGDDALHERALTAVGTVATLGRDRMAGALALRTAMTARATGRHGTADALLARARALLPDDLSGWEARWQQRAARAGEASTGNRLRLLAATAVAEVGGRAVPLAPAHARLLAVLACLGRPVSTDTLADALWPDVDAASARGRLKSAHHRLRLALGPDADALVRREHDVWTFATTGWSVDLAEFDRLAAGGPDERLAALRLPTGLLWNAQLPFDDVLAELRAPLEVRWLALADRLLRDGSVTAAEVARIAGPLGVEVPGT